MMIANGPGPWPPTPVLHTDRDNTERCRAIAGPVDVLHADKRCRAIAGPADVLRADSADERCRAFAGPRF
jgi:hypothetical protein